MIDGEYKKYCPFKQHMLITKWLHLGRIRYFAFLPHYQNAWILDKCWVQITKKEDNITNDIDLDSIQLNKAIGYDQTFKDQSIDQLTIPNNLGVYHNKYHTKKNIVTNKIRKGIKLFI